MEEEKIAECIQAILPIRDALHILSGKWKLQIIVALTFTSRRFSQLEKDIPGITPRMLSKELRELETTELVKRTVYDTIPVSIEYSLTDHGKTLKNVIVALRDWGMLHRKHIMPRSDDIVADVR